MLVGGRVPMQPPVEPPAMFWPSRRSTDEFMLKTAGQTEGHHVLLLRCLMLKVNSQNTHMNTLATAGV